VQKPCAIGYVAEAKSLGNGKVWLIPKHTENPADSKTKSEIK
jgi:hypothetical protein